jgi:FtsZ-binding cell division protein ZapB
MKKNNYMLKLAHENYMLKLKCNSLQNEIQELKEKQETLYRTHANTVLMLQTKKSKNPRSASF